MSGHKRSPAAFRRELGQRIRALRLQRELSQEQLALEALVTQGSISNYESGRHEIPIAVLISICRALKTTPIDLIPLLAGASTPSSNVAG